MSTPSTPRRLVRRTDDRMIAGVASGLADLFGLDPVLVRIGFVVLAFAGGAGVVIYGALWLLDARGRRRRRAPSPRPATAVRRSGSRSACSCWRRWPWPTPSPTGPSCGRSCSSAPASRCGAPTAPARGPRPLTAGATPGGPEAPAPTWTPPPPPSGAAPSCARAPAPTARRVRRTRPLPADPVGPGGPGWTPPPARVRGALPARPADHRGGAADRRCAGDPRRHRRAGLHRPDAFAVALLVVGAGLVVGAWVGAGPVAGVARDPRAAARPACWPRSPTSSTSRSAPASGNAPSGPRPPPTSTARTSSASGTWPSTWATPTSTASGSRPPSASGFGQATVDRARRRPRRGRPGRSTGGQVELFDGDRQGRGLDGSAVFPGAEGAGTLVLDIDVAVGQVTLVRESDRPMGDRVPPGESFDGVDFGLAPHALTLVTDPTSLGGPTMKTHPTDLLSLVPGLLCVAIAALALAGGLTVDALTTGGCGRPCSWPSACWCWPRPAWVGAPRRAPRRPRTRSPSSPSAAPPTED